MRILILHPSGGFAGVESALIGMVEGLCGWAEQVTVVVPPGAMITPHLVRCGALVVEHPVAWWTPPLSGMDAVDAAAQNASLLVAFLCEIARLQRIDMVISNTTACFDGVVAAALGGLPHVTILHAPYTEATNPDYSTADRTRIYRIFFDYSEAVVVPADHLAAHLRDHGVAADKLVVIGNAVDPGKFRAEPRRRPVRRFVTLAEINPNKNQLLSVNAMALAVARGADAELHLHGSAVADYEKTVRKAIEDGGLGDRVFLHGPTDAVAQVLREADCYITASRSEVMPMAVLEAMAAGLAVIAYDNPASRELIENGETGWIVDSAQGMAERIIDLVARPEHARRSGEAARRHIERHLAPQVLHARLKTVLDGASRRSAATDIDRVFPAFGARSPSRTLKALLVGDRGAIGRLTANAVIRHLIDRRRLAITMAPGTGAPGAEDVAEMRLAADGADLVLIEAAQRSWRRLARRLAGPGKPLVLLEEGNGGNTRKDGQCAREVRDADLPRIELPPPIDIAPDDGGGQAGLLQSAAKFLSRLSLFVDEALCRRRLAAMEAVPGHAGGRPTLLPLSMQRSGFRALPREGYLSAYQEIAEELRLEAVWCLLRTGGRHGESGERTRIAPILEIVRNGHIVFHESAEWMADGGERLHRLDMGERGIRLEAGDRVEYRLAVAADTPSVETGMAGEEIAIWLEVRE